MEKILDEKTRLTISIAMATYNGEKYIREQLDSIAAQTSLPDELIISDDGSSDDTIEIAKAFQASSPFEVKIFENFQRLGYRKNFMKAANKGSGDLIFFCDQDDIWMPHKIARMVEAFDASDVLMAYHKADLIDATGSRFDNLHHQNFRNPWQQPNGMLMSFRRSLLLRQDLIDISRDFYEPSQPLAHDQWISLLADAFGRISAVDDVLVQYRQHADNVTGAGQPQLSQLKKLRHRIKDRSQSFEVLTRTSKLNAIIFNELSVDSSLSNLWKEKAQISKLAFEELAALYEARSSIYLEDSTLKRLTALLSFIKMNAYTGTQYWRFNKPALLRDFVLGVSLGPLVRMVSTEKVWGDANCRRLWQV